MKFFRAYPTLKPHILFYSNGLATWYGFPVIHILRSIIAACWPFLFNRVEIFQDINIEWIVLTGKFLDQKKVKVIWGHRKVKCENNQALVMINLYSTCSKKIFFFFFEKP